MLRLIERFQSMSELRRPEFAFGLEGKVFRNDPENHLAFAPPGNSCIAFIFWQISPLSSCPDQQSVQPLRGHTLVTGFHKLVHDPQGSMSFDQSDICLLPQRFVAGFERVGGSGLALAFSSVRIWIIAR